MAASRVKSISFRDDEQHLLSYADNQGNFSEYIKGLIKADMEKGFKFTKEQERAIIDLIKKYAPTVTDADLNKEFEKESLEALNQFDDM